MGFATFSSIEYGACFKQAPAEAAFFLQIVNGKEVTSMPAS